MAIDTNHFKQKLEEEKARLEGELKGLGRINPDNPKDWEPTAEDINAGQSDPNDRADSITDFEERSAVEVELENRYDNIRDALARLEAGTYGTCKVCGKEIETGRLEANPAAQTCKEHINE